MVSVVRVGEQACVAARYDRVHVQCVGEPEEAQHLVELLLVLDVCREKHAPARAWGQCSGVRARARAGVSGQG